MCVCEKGHNGSVNCVKFSPDGSWLASAGDDNLVKVLFVFSLSQLMTVIHIHRFSLSSLMSLKHCYLVFHPYYCNLSLESLETLETSSVHC